MTDRFRDVFCTEKEEKIRMLLGNMLFSDRCVADLLPEASYDKTLQEIYETVRTPWGRPFPADEIMKAANLADEIYREKKWEVRSLWKEDTEVVHDHSAESVCLFTPQLEDENKRAAILLVPGGAYETISMIGEGFDLAEIFAGKGYRPYILRYRVKPNRFPKGQLDLALAILHIRAHAEEDHTDKSDLTIAGFSAGGHLCASMVTHAEEIKSWVLKELEEKRAWMYKELPVLPEKMILGYSVLSLKGKYCEGLADICREEEKSYYSPMEQIPEVMPKTFCWACRDDGLVPWENSVDLHENLRQRGHKSCCRIYPYGGHGIAAGRGTSAENWIEEMLAFMKE